MSDDVNANAGRDTVAGFRVGDSASFEVVIEQTLIDQFVALTGDDNPVHIDPEFARETTLGRPIAHGMLGASFVSTLVGKHIPGAGALWLSQSFEFLKPVRVGDTLTFEAEVSAVHAAMNVLTLAVQVRNQRGESVTTGTGRVKTVASRQRVERAGSAEKGLVLVTGASGTIGAAVAAKLAELQYTVVLAHGSHATDAQVLSERLNRDGATTWCAGVDLADEQSVASLVANVERRGGAIRSLVHVAATPVSPCPMAQTRWSQIETHLDVGVRGLLSLVHAALPGMLDAGGGSIVALTSEARDLSPTPGWGGYLMAKAALEALMYSLAAELGPKGVRANLVSPGLVESAMTLDVPERARLMLAQQTPLRRLCEPDDVASAVAFLVSGEAAFINGETLRLSGGRVTR